MSYASGIIVGEVVKLKSGGPLMTVRSVYSAEEGQTATCDWFVHANASGYESKQGYFPLTSLEAQR